MVGGQKKLGQSKFLHFYQAFNCQDKVKIKLTLYLVSCNLPNLTEFQKHLIRQRLEEGITIRAIANELTVSKNTVLWHFCLMS
jgi:DNA-binding NarL/FixJ family response regulator